MRELTILSVAYPFSILDADSAGGAEQVLSILDEALVQAGHRSLVVAQEGSQVHGELIPITSQRESLDGTAIGRVHSAVRGAVARTIENQHVDVIHVHGLDFDRYFPPEGVPLLATLHLPPSWYSREALAPTRPNTHLCCVSDAQCATLPRWASEAEVVENGIRVDAFKVGNGRANYCLMLARLCPEKGVHEALEATTQVGCPLWLAGSVSSFQSHRQYFEREIQPRLNGKHRYLGPVGGERKHQLLAGARALLVPSRVPETSSLVSMEALASGTPVVAYRFGALPTIIEHGETGFIVDGVQAMAEAISRVSQIDSARCRATAVERFSAASMVGRYLSIYTRLAEQNARSSQQAYTKRIRIDKIQGMTALTRFEREWSTLVDRDPHATPFQRPEWLLAYARAFCKPDQDGNRDRSNGPVTNADPWALIAWDGEQLVGMLPLCTRSAHGEASVRLLGDGLSDHLDLIAEPAQAVECARLFLAALMDPSNDCTRLMFDELREASPLNTVQAPEDAQETRFVRAPCPVLRLMAGLDVVPASMRAKVRYYARRAERLGQVEFETATHAAAGAWLEILFALHGKRWASRGERGVFATPWLREFQRDATLALACAGRAKVLGLRVNGRPAAAMLLLCDRTTAYYYIGGFDPALADASPGTLLIWHAIEAAQREGSSEFDFLRGNEAYKYRFGARDRFNHGRHLTRTGRVR